MLCGFAYEKDEAVGWDENFYTYWYACPWLHNAWRYVPKDYLHVTRELCLGFAFMCVEVK